MREILGVGLLLFASINNIPKMYTVEELKDKPAILKEAGMIGPPFETMKENDQDVMGTLLRLIQEETPFSFDLISIQDIIPKKFTLIPGRNDIYTQYAYATFKGNPSKISQLVDTDIRFAGWHSMAELSTKFIRIETGPILEDFRKNGYYAKLCHLL